MIPAASLRVVEAARRLGIEIEVSSFPESTKTAAEAAAAIGCPVAAIVKSLVFVIDGEPVVALVPGDLRLDPTKLSVAGGGGEVRRASLEEVREATGYGAGGTPPFGHSRKLRVFADPALSRHDPVWAAAGTPNTVFPVSPTDLLAATGATWTDLT